MPTDPPVVAEVERKAEKLIEQLDQLANGAVNRHRHGDDWPALAEHALNQAIWLIRDDLLALVRRLQQERDRWAEGCRIWAEKKTAPYEVGFARAWEACHANNRCGHPMAANRDPKWGTPEYRGEERCEICAAEAEVAQLRARLADYEDDMHGPDGD